MPVTVSRDRLREAEITAAWLAYLDFLRGLPTEVYEMVEPSAWQQLQSTLRAIR